MLYLKSFSLATELDETNYLFDAVKFDMACYGNNAYPFKIFPFKMLSRLDFAPITILYGGNGSGKSTILNIISEKLRLNRSAPFNNTPIMDDYLRYCKYELSTESRGNVPNDSRIITSDGVFDFLLDARAINEGVERDRERLFDEYKNTVKTSADGWQMRSLDEYEELKRRNEARRSTKSQYVGRRMNGVELDMKSNGESAYVYFTEKIRDNALYLLDEPENSLSAALQGELARFLEDSARFYDCQFIISTHSPFLLSMKGAKIYDLDSVPVTVKRWNELQNVRAYYELFKRHSKDFE